MKIRFLSAVGFLIMASMPFAAWAGACSPAPFPNVQTSLLDPQHRLSTSKSLRQINSMANRSGLHSKGKTTQGITQSIVEALMSARFSGYTPPGGRVCITLTDLRVTFGHRKLLVYVPREYVRGSCEYNVILRHEMAHVNVNRGAVRKYAAILDFELKQEMQRSRTLQTTTMTRGKQIFQKRVQAIINRVLNSHAKEIKALHANIDSPNSPYAAEGRCKAW